MPSTQAPPHPMQAREFFPAAAIVRDGSFAVLDEVDTATPGTLVYCQNLHYLQKAGANAHISAILCPPALQGELIGSSAALIVADDPRRCFFELYIKLQESGALLPHMTFGMGDGCHVHPSAVISPKTRIGHRARIGANAVIEDYCHIGDDVEIGPNVVIGAEGLMTLRQPDGRLMTVRHSGGVEIGDGCQILAGTVIAKSMFRRFTRIGRHCQVGIMTNIGHGASIGEACVVSGNSVIAGRTQLGNRVWVGTSVSVAQGLRVGEGAQIKMGSVVVADVPDGAVVSGNFAVSHRVNMARYLKGAI